MKILVISIMVGIFLIGLVSGGILDSDWITCLEENCNSFCSEYGMDGGEYYSGNQCSCKDYKQTSNGKFVINEEKIQIEECGGGYEKRSLSSIIFWIIIIVLNVVMIIALIRVVRKMSRS